MIRWASRPYERRWIGSGTGGVPASQAVMTMEASPGGMTSAVSSHGSSKLVHGENGSIPNVTTWASTRWSSG
jgi:hypothetical protein